MAPDSGWAGLGSGHNKSCSETNTLHSEGRLMQGSQCIRENGGRAEQIRDVQKGTG